MNILNKKSVKGVYNVDFLYLAKKKLRKYSNMNGFLTYENTAKSLWLIFLEKLLYSLKA